MPETNASADLVTREPRCSGAELGGGQQGALHGTQRHQFSVKPGFAGPAEGGLAPGQRGLRQTLDRGHDAGDMLIEFLFRDNAVKQTPLQRRDGIDGLAEQYELGGPGGPGDSGPPGRTAHAGTSPALIHELANVALSAA